MICSGSLTLKKLRLLLIKKNRATPLKKERSVPLIFLWLCALSPIWISAETLDVDDPRYKHDKEAQVMAENSRKFAQDMLDPEIRYLYFYKLLVTL